MPSSMRLQLAPVVPPPYHQDLHRLLRHTNRSSAAALAPSNSLVLPLRPGAEDSYFETTHGASYYESGGAGLRRSRSRAPPPQPRGALIAHDENEVLKGVRSVTHESHSLSANSMVGARQPACKPTSTCHLNTADWPTDALSSTNTMEFKAWGRQARTKACLPQLREAMLAETSETPSEAGRMLQRSTSEASFQRPSDLATDVTRRMPIMPRPSLHLFQPPPGQDVEQDHTLQRQQSATRMAFSQPGRAVPVKTAGHVPRPDLQYTRSVAELLTWANPEGRAEDISKRRSRGEGVRL